MTKPDRTGHDKPRKRKWSEQQIERWIAALGGLVLVAVIGIYLMIRAWGFWGLILRFLGLVLAVLLCWLAWKFRRPLWAWFKAGVRRLAVAAWAAITQKQSARYRALVNECTDEQGRTLIPISRLAALVDMQARQRFNPAQSGWICAAAERAGYCIEPDARLADKPYRAEDVVTAFPHVSGDRTSPDRYRAADCFVRMGLAIAAADGHASADELALLIAQIQELFQLNEHELRRLKALMTLLAATENSTAGLRPAIAGLRAEQKQAVAKMLLALAAVDGAVTREEIRALRKLHKALGFERQEIDQALAALRKTAQGPVTIRPAGIAPAGEAIPPPPAEAEAAEEESFRLDHAAIAAIMDDTRQVAHMLAEAMKADEDGSTAGQAWRSGWAGPAVLENAPAMAPKADLVAGPPAAQAGQAEATADADPCVQPAPAQPAPVPPADGGQALPQAEPAAAVAPPAEPAPLAETDPTPAETDPTLPAPYASFYRVLISRKEWPVKEITALARQQGLMFSAAIDALNEWAAQKHGGQLFIEEGPTLLVEHEYLT